MISLQEALDSYARTLAPLPEKSIPVIQSLHRVLAKPACSLIELPRFTQSAMDGYALSSRETVDATPSNPVQLHIAGTMPAGHVASQPALGAGECWRILTGGSVPTGADSIAPQEIVELTEDRILLRSPMKADSNIRHAGEELKKDELLAKAGQRITPGLLAALVMAGVASVSVRQQPRIHVLVTGDELRPPGSRLRAGETFDSNGPLVRSYLLSRGYPEPQVVHVRDSRQDLKIALTQALDTADLVITTGGVSVGDRDLVPELAEAHGVKKQFWKVAQKPGKPLFYGLRGKTVLLGLPGNPGAVLIGLVLHLRHVLDCLEGASPAGARFNQGRLAADVAADTRRDRLVRMEMSVDPEGFIRLSPLPRQDSHMLSNLGSAAVLVHLPAREASYSAGNLARWTPLPGMCFI